VALAILLVTEAQREADVEVVSSSKILPTLFLSPPLHQSNSQMVEGLYQVKYLQKMSKLIQEQSLLNIHHVDDCNLITMHTVLVTVNISAVRYRTNIP